MRHTWHADQETTVLLHFCHHLPTDFFHIRIWMGGLDFLSRSSPLAVSQQKAPLVRFLAQQLITPGDVFWLRGCRRVKSLALTSICQQHLIVKPRVPGGWAVNCQKSRTQNDEHSVKSAAQITSFSSLQSLLLICVWWEGRSFEGCVTFGSAHERRLGACITLSRRIELEVLSSGSPANNYALINLEKLELHYNPQKFSN